MIQTKNAQNPCDLDVWVRPGNSIWF